MTTNQTKKVSGCNCSGGCNSGGCNRLNTFDWLTALDIQDVQPCNLAEVSFKNGTAKDFFTLNSRVHVDPGDMVVVDTGNGSDVGYVNLVGELVRLQLKKSRKSENDTFPSILRIATDRDIDDMNKARGREKSALIKAREIARDLKLKMKISDVRFQSDQRKGTFYFIADQRVDFRELIKRYASTFSVKVEMKQIGSRQESALVGGIGSCGRELCCSTWLTKFKSVNTSAARYQNLAINQTKLSGQCGRLKCCLNFELDMYIEALKEYPRDVRKIKSEQGVAYFVKNDIFKREMYFSFTDSVGRNTMIGLDPERVQEILKLNSDGKKPTLFKEAEIVTEEPTVSEVDFEENLTGVIDLPVKPKKSRNKRRRQNTRNKPQRKNQNKGGEARQKKNRNNKKSK